VILSFAKKNGQRHRRREHRHPGPHRIPGLSSPTNTCQMSGRMPDVICQIERQLNCQINSLPGQIECQIECLNIRQNRCQLKCQSTCQIECQMKCQINCRENVSWWESLEEHTVNLFSGFTIRLQKLPGSLGSEI
jgi:hypothetical protein